MQPCSCRNNVILWIMKRSLYFYIMFIVKNQTQGALQNGLRMETWWNSEWKTEPALKSKSFPILFSPLMNMSVTPWGLLNKRFYKMLSSMPYWGGLLIRLNGCTSVVSGGVNGALYKSNAVLMQTKVLLDTYLGHAKVCIRATLWEKVLDWKEKLNFGVNVNQLLQVRGLWGVTLSCEVWQSPNILLEENHRRNKSWSTGYKPTFVATQMGNDKYRLYIAYLTTYWHLAMQRGTSLTLTLGIHFWMVNTWRLYNQMLNSERCLNLTVIPLLSCYTWWVGDELITPSGEIRARSEAFMPKKVTTLQRPQLRPDKNWQGKAGNTGVYQQGGPPHRANI